MARVLVVEDEPDLRRLYAWELQDAGYEVVTAANGAEALGRLSSDPDVVLVDLMMPVMDGYEFLARLRADPRHRDIPALVVSAVGTGAWSLRAGANDWLRKPFDTEELRRRVDRVVAD
jgi:CheY-like chemotaxis protein